MDISLGASAIAPIASIVARVAGSRYWLEYFLVFVGIGGWGFGIISWYSTAVRKNYAAEQDFKAIARWMERCHANQAEILKDQDRRFDSIDGDLREIKALYQALMIAKSDRDSGFFRSRGDSFPG